MVEEVGTATTRRPGTQESSAPASFRLKLRPFTRNGDQHVAGRADVHPPAGGSTILTLIAITPGPALNLLYAKSLWMESAGSRSTFQCCRFRTARLRSGVSFAFMMWAGAADVRPSR